MCVMRASVCVCVCCAWTQTTFKKQKFVMGLQFYTNSIRSILNHYFSKIFKGIKLIKCICTHFFSSNGTKGECATDIGKACVFIRMQTKQGAGRRRMFTK